MVTGEGAWKLAGFAFAVTAATAANAPAYHYSDPFPPLYEELSRVRRKHVAFVVGWLVCAQPTHALPYSIDFMGHEFATIIWAASNTMYRVASISSAI
jgi:hypothetical protein